MHKILTLNNIASKGLEAFPLDQYEISSEASNPTGILVRSAKMHEMDLPDSLLAIGRAGVGVDNIPVDKCSEAGIAVFNTPGANANAVAELVMAGILMTSRRLLPGAAFAQGLSGTPEEVHKAAEAGKKQFGGQEIAGRTLGLIGLGAIGGRVAVLAHAMGMKVIGYDPWLSVPNALQLPREIVRTDFLQEVYKNSDYISVHVPLFDKTRDLLDDSALALCKKGVRLLNFSRGGIVNNQSVLKGIAEEKVGAYATDFTHPELLGNDKVICLPHLGASTAESEENCAVMASAQVKEFIESGNVSNSINFPEAFVPRSGKCRLTVFTRNVPKMVATISSLLGNRGINIADLVNKSKNDFAYNILDLDSECPDEVVQELAATEGVLRVRLIQ